MKAGWEADSFRVKVTVFSSSAPSSISCHAPSQDLCRTKVTFKVCFPRDILAHLPRNLGISGSGLSVILGNLWENAVAAAVSAPKDNRRVQLRARVQDERVMIQMENGFSGQVFRQGDRFFSTKRGDGQTEGIGIASVRAIAARYGGMADFSYTADTFTTSVLLYPPPLVKPIAACKSKTQDI